MFIGQLIPWSGVINRMTSFSIRFSLGALGLLALIQSVLADGSAWKVVAQMPAGVHDIMAAELNGKLYVAGGLGARGKETYISDEIWELSPLPWHWRVLANLGHKRIYNATASFDGKVWLIGGDVLDSTTGKRVTVAMVQICDPATGTISNGPDLLLPRPKPLALVAGGRLYVIGVTDGHGPCPIESIGSGETQWRNEPPGPAGMDALAGTVLDNKIYIDFPTPGLAIFDPAASTWELVNTPLKTRSCQMAAYQNEIWMMGGRGGQQRTMIYNPQSKAFRDGPAIPEDLSWGAAGVVQGQLVETGGATYAKPPESGTKFSDRTYVLSQP